jgi:hypothetical protein
MGIRDFLFKKKCGQCNLVMEDYHASGDFFYEIRSGASRAVKILFARFTGMNEEKMLNNEKAAYLRCPGCGKIVKK